MAARRRINVRISNLAGAGELATLVGVESATIHKWRERHSDFPEPIVELGQGEKKMPVWDASEVEKWVAKRAARVSKAFG